MIYGYARVSTRKQAKDGTSLESQIDELKQNGAAKIYKDAFTGVTMDRPQFNKLMKVLQPGDTLVVCKLDRFARSVSQASDLLTKLIDRDIKVNILNLGVLSNDSVSTMMRNILLCFAQFEHDMIIERTQEGLAIARTKDGFRCGRKPLPQARIDTAMELCKTHSVSEVCKMTGISRATIFRYKENGNVESRKSN